VPLWLATDDSSVNSACQSVGCVVLPCCRSAQKGAVRVSRSCASVLSATRTGSYVRDVGRQRVSMCCCCLTAINRISFAWYQPLACSEQVGARADDAGPNGIDVSSSPERAPHLACSIYCLFNVVVP
jgi:hypothetical protein